MRGSVLTVRPLTQSAKIAGIGGNIKSPDSTIPGLDISYFFTDHWALEFQAGRAESSYAVIGSSAGSFSVGRIKSGVLSFVVQYHFRPAKSIKPYVGIGANYAWALDVQPAANIPDFDVKPVTSPLIAMGVDIGVAPSWVINANVRYLMSPSYGFSGEGFSASVRINTLVLGTGVGFLF